MGDLTGRIAVVTGAGRGIGAAIVKRMLNDKVKGVAMLDYDETLLEASAKTLSAKTLDPEGKRVFRVVCDVSSREQVHSAVTKIIEHFGVVDILVNNAGITRDKIFHKMDPANWDLVLNINLNGPFNLCREIVPLMRERNYGRIVNISSTSAFGNAGQANYAASKAGLIGFTKTLAKEGGPKNITANCIAPGYIDTDMLQAVPPDVLKGYLAIIPMNRLGKPEEIASAVSFFASDDASFVTGQYLIVNGGAST
jgi:3-oxoacyl-[acyl-carrier protein] reductase